MQCFFLFQLYNVAKAAMIWLWSDDHPHEDLAKFGYISDSISQRGIYKTLGILLYFCDIAKTFYWANFFQINSLCMMSALTFSFVSPRCRNLQNKQLC
jgi:hypothetical protein